jgi:peroxiredoxin
MANTPPLVAGLAAPDFEVLDIDGRGQRLSAYRGAPLLLSFYRYITCPMCNLRIGRLQNEYPKYADRLAFLAVFESPAAYIRQYTTRPLPFPVIADPDGTLYRRYGVKRDWIGVLLGFLRMRTAFQAMRGVNFRMAPSGGHLDRIPADFLIDPAGTVVAAYDGTDITDPMPFSTLERNLKTCPPAVEAV